MGTSASGTTIWSPGGISSKRRGKPLQPPRDGSRHPSWLTKLSKSIHFFFLQFSEHPFMSILGAFWTPTWSRNLCKISKKVDPWSDLENFQLSIKRFLTFCWILYAQNLKSSAPVEAGSSFLRFWLSVLASNFHPLSGPFLDGFWDHFGSRISPKWF